MLSILFSISIILQPPTESKPKTSDYPAAKKLWQDDQESKRKLVKATLKKNHEADNKKRREQLESATDQLKTLNETFAKSNAQKRKMLQGEIRKCQETIDNINNEIIESKYVLAAEEKKADEMVIYHKLEDLRLNAFGKIDPSHKFKVISVVDAERAIVTVGDRVFCVQNSTKGIVDGDEFSITTFVHVNDTFQYTNALNVRKTIFQLTIIK